MLNIRFHAFTCVCFLIDHFIFMSPGSNHRGSLICAGSFFPFLPGSQSKESLSNSNSFGKKAFNYNVMFDWITYGCTAEIKISKYHCITQSLLYIKRTLINVLKSYLNCLIIITINYKVFIWELERLKINFHFIF